MQHLELVSLTFVPAAAVYKSFLSKERKSISFQMDNLAQGNAADNLQATVTDLILPVIPEDDITKAIKHISQ